MYYNNLNIPIILEVGFDFVLNIDEILKKHNLVFENKVLLTEDTLFYTYKKNLELIGFKDLFFVTEPSLVEVEELERNKIPNNSLLIGFGGGKVLDVVKLLAERLNLPYLSIPSTLSNDGIYSPISRLFDKGKKKSFGVKPPIGIIADLSIISQSPKINILAGVGDLVSNLSALEDWKLAKEVTGEVINDFAFSLSYLSASSIVEYTGKDIFQKDFLQRLAYGLIISGFSMVIAGNSRPCSGAEHQISHTIDEYFSDRASLHGLQVAWGQLLIENNYRKENYLKLFSFYEKVGVIRSIEKEINFSDDEIFRILGHAKSIRKRYTILSCYEF